METIIHPSRKLLVVFLAYLGIAVVSLVYGIHRMSSLLVVLATAILVVSFFLLHFFLSKYRIAEDGLYQIRKLSGVSFVPWDKVGQVFIEQGFMEKRWGMGDLRIVEKSGRQLMRWRGIPQPQRVSELIRDGFARYAILHRLPEMPVI